MIPVVLGAIILSHISFAHFLRLASLGLELLGSIEERTWPSR